MGQTEARLSAFMACLQGCPAICAYGQNMFASFLRARLRPACQRSWHAFRCALLYMGSTFASCL